MTQLEQIPPCEVHWQSPSKYLQNLKELCKLTRQKNILNIHKQNKNAPSVSSYNYHLLYLNSCVTFESASKHLDMCLSPLIALMSITVKPHVHRLCSHKQWHLLSEWHVLPLCQQTMAEKPSDRQQQRLCATQDEQCKTLFDIHCLQLDLSPLDEPSPSL